MKLVFRLSVALLLGNTLGYLLFRLAAWASSLSWAGPPPSSFGELLWRMGLTAIVFGAPPVIMGALAGRFVQRYEPLVGLASALWGITARWWWPEQVRHLPPESWIAPMVIIFLSGLVGGWLVSRPFALPPGSVHSSASNDS